MIINMPVEAYSEKCITCPELDIDIITKEFYDLEQVKEGDTKVKTARYENILKCKHCGRCKVIFDQGTEKPEPKPKKTTTKKVSGTTKTVTAKTATKTKTAKVTKK